MNYLNLEQRIIANTFFDIETGCWIWLGKSILSRRSKRPYPVMTVRVPGVKSPRNVRVHRKVLEIFKGFRMTKVHVGEHVCPARNTLCVCPDHLTRGTYKTNAARRESEARS